MSEPRTCKVCGEVKAISEFSLMQKGQPYRRYICTDCRYEAKIASRYGLSVQEYRDLIEEHDNCCAICKVHADDTGSSRCKRLFVDHCHRTGRVRGLLCHRCNSAIGLLDDSTTKLLAAVHYLSS